MTPCPPPPPPRGAKVRRHSSCLLCRLMNGDPATVFTVAGVPFAGPVADLSPAGVTIDTDDALQYFPWTSVLFLRWEPVEAPASA